MRSASCLVVYLGLALSKPPSGENWHLLESRWSAQPYSKNPQQSPSIKAKLSQVLPQPGLIMLSKYVP